MAETETRSRLGRVGTTTIDFNVNRDLFNRKFEWRQEPNPEGPSDKNLAVVAFLGDDNVPIGVHMNYAMHPINFYLSGVISADLPGEASRYVEDLFDNRAVAIFSQGASGDQNPRDFRSPTTFMGQRDGRDAGPRAFYSDRGRASGAGGSCARWLDAQRASSERKPVPAENMDAYKKVLARTGDYVRMLGSSSARPRFASCVSPCRPRTRRASGMARRCSHVQAGFVSTPTIRPVNVFPGYKVGGDVNLKVGLLRIGDIHFVAVNGEVYSQIAIRLKAEAPARKTIP